MNVLLQIICKKLNFFDERKCVVSVCLCVLRARIAELAACDCALNNMARHKRRSAPVLFNVSGSMAKIS